MKVLVIKSNKYLSRDEMIELGKQIAYSIEKHGFVVLDKSIESFSVEDFDVVKAGDTGFYRLDGIDGAINTVVPDSCITRFLKKIKNGEDTCAGDLEVKQSEQ